MLYLAAVIRFHAEKDVDRHEWQAVTDGYTYALCPDDDLDAAIVSWHWHPRRASWSLPHIHVSWEEGPIDDFKRVHLPTSVVSFEQVLLFLMRDPRIKAIPAKRDAAEYLERTVERLGNGLIWPIDPSETE